jgi:hypothetical protein
MVSNRISVDLLGGTVKLAVGRALPAWVHFFAESFQVRKGDYSVPVVLEAMIVSPGGVASTAIMEYIGQFVRVNSPGDRDTLKHRPKPPGHSSKEIPVLLITGDSDSIIASLDRRGYFPHQAIRLGCWKYFLVPTRWRDGAFRKCVCRQEKAWTRNYSNTLTLGFAEIWDSADLIAKHFGINDPKFVENFPHRR